MFDWMKAWGKHQHEVVNTDLRAAEERDAAAAARAQGVNTVFSWTPPLGVLGSGLGSQTTFNENMEKLRRLWDSLFPLYLPDGWGFAPAGDKGLALITPKGKEWSVRAVLGAQATVPCIKVQCLDAPVSTAEMFTDKESFLIYLITLNSESNDEKN